MDEDQGEWVTKRINIEPFRIIAAPTDTKVLSRSGGLGLGGRRIIRLTTKERILLHLFDYAKYGGAVEVPPDATQEGIARASGIDVPHFTQYIRPLVLDGLVQERTAHVKGVLRRRKVYDLTDAGKMRAIRLRETVKAEVVRVQAAGGIQQATVSQVFEEARGKASLLDIVRQATETGIVDLVSLTREAPAAFVEMITEAPRLGPFAGRRGELEAVTRDAEGPRVFVVRGVPGIGKSIFAAKACELFRGKRNLFWHRIRPWDTSQSILAHLGDFLSALGRPGLRSVLTRGEASRAAEVLRADLPGTQSFLVFDDAHEARPEVQSVFRLLKEALPDAPDVRALMLTRQAIPFYDRRDVTIQGLVGEIDLEGLSPEDITVLLGREQDAPWHGDLLRRLGGHPLFIDLMRAHPTVPLKGLRDVRRFVEEEIYTKLSDAERKLMKTASLYRVPVLRESLFSDPALSHDVVLSLTERGLIKVVGEESFEVHDTIRDVFASFLTASERRDLAKFATGQLVQLAAKARSSGDSVRCIGCLSNALQLPAPPDELAMVWETLGEANERIGDWSAALIAYKEAVRATTEPAVLARLHTKTASALRHHGDLAAASKEVEEGFRVLGDTSGVERAWLHLAKCRISRQLEEWAEAREHGDAALRTFQILGDLQGQIQSLLLLGDIELHSPPGNLAVSAQRYDSALALSVSIADPQLLTDLHTQMAHLLSAHAGDVERAMKHIAAVEALPAAMNDPHVRRLLLLEKGHVNISYRGDYSAGVENLTEPIALARRIHDPATVVEAKWSLAHMLYDQGRIDEARREFERVAREAIVQGKVQHTVDSMFRVGLCCVLQADVESFRQIIEGLRDPKLSTAVETHTAFVRILEGLDRLMRGDAEASHAAFTSALQVDRMPYLLYSHFFYGLALRAMGRERDAAEHLSRAAKIAASYGRKPWMAQRLEMERSFASALRRAFRASKSARLGAASLTQTGPP